MNIFSIFGFLATALAAVLSGQPVTEQTAVVVGPSSRTLNLTITGVRETVPEGDAAVEVSESMLLPQLLGIIASLETKVVSTFTDTFMVAGTKSNGEAYYVTLKASYTF